MKALAAYLLLVTFYGAALQGQGGGTDWSALRGAPYDGVVVRLLGAYDVSEPDYDTLAAEMKRVRDDTGMDPWPFVFMNRMVGLPERSVRAGAHGEAAREVFSSIKGMDLTGEAHARKAFIESWRTALSLAREAGSPGAVLDLELYNDAGMYRVDKLAERLGMSEEETVSALEALGRDLADVTDETYPDAVVWSLLAGMGKDDYQWTGRMLSVGYVSKGFLDRCVEKEYKVVYVAGGEVSLGYCPGPLVAMKNRMFQRDKAYGRFRAAYPDNLALGGTIAPWNDPAKRTGWLAGCDCGGGDEKKGVKGLTAHLVELMDTYDYVWIYAASAAPYDPFDPEMSGPYNETISVARDISAGNRAARPAPLSSGSVRGAAP